MAGGHQLQQQQQQDMLALLSQQQQQQQQLRAQLEQQQVLQVQQMQLAQTLQSWQADTVKAIATRAPNLQDYHAEGEQLKGCCQRTLHAARDALTVFTAANVAKAAADSLHPAGAPCDGTVAAVGPLTLLPAAHTLAAQAAAVVAADLDAADRAAHAAAAADASATAAYKVARDAAADCSAAIRLLSAAVPPEVRQHAIDAVTLSLAAARDDVWYVALVARELLEEAGPGGSAAHRSRVDKIGSVRSAPEGLIAPSPPATVPEQLNASPRTAVAVKTLQQGRRRRFASAQQEWALWVRFAATDRPAAIAAATAGSHVQVGRVH
jgi:hypothetical protein